MKTLRILLPAAALVAAVAFAAQPMNIRPGNWTVTTTMTMGGAPLYVEGMPAAGRAEYAKTWATQVGKPISQTDEECITEKEVREMDVFKDMQRDAKSCKTTITRQTATAVAGTMECTDAKTSTRTVVDYTATSPTTFRGSFKSTTTSPNGTTTMDLAMSGKWLAASCPAGDDDEDSDDSSED
jgi:hypothetical protein